MWRIFSLPIHARHPTVQHLSVHLENGQRVYFTKANLQQQLQEPRDTTLTAFFKLCTLDDFAKTLLYCQLPAYYTFDASTKCWKRRVHGAAVPDHPGIYQTDALARVYTVQPNNRECFFLRIMLHHVVGPMSFQHLRTVEGHVCATFHEACRRLGLLEDDAQWREALEEAATVRSPAQLRKLFAIMLSTCQLSHPLQLWQEFKEHLAEDTLFHERQLLQDQQLQFTDRMEILRETAYDREELRRHVEINEPLLLEEQRAAYNTVLEKIEQNSGGIVFFHAPGGTGKTFVTNLILAKVRESGKIALAVASSGIAATLLPGGRIAHSALKLPLNLARTENPVCNIKKNSGTAQLLQRCVLIVWDECTMSHKLAFEALNLTLKDLRENNRLFGGVPLLLSGDFRQTLPVIQRGTPADEINACIKSSFLWPSVVQLHLTRNMRAAILGDETSAHFAAGLLRIGEGRLPAKIISASGRGEYVFIPRIPIIPTDLPFEFKRIQFPIRVCFAMTINKSQGQSLKVAVGAFRNRQSNRKTVKRLLKALHSSLRRSRQAVRKLALHVGVQLAKTANTDEKYGRQPIANDTAEKA
ncbi:ATP-dependent DNA helicase PIF2-like [Watersipora subatra]|uniref:ATP-dependent DNA helicase PIF2-like n=1 Tax=Watersipora subatra TaxID=2589382 RepID=UPI00355C2A73